MDVYDEMVMSYLVRHGNVFVSPQFDMKTADGKPWSCPDFVALDLANKLVSVVEVSTASNISGLAERVNDRQNQWIDKLKDQLIRERLVDETWKDYQVQVFVRQDQKDWFEKRIKDRNHVNVHTVEEVCFGWRPECGKES